MKSPRSRKELRQERILTAFEENPALRVNQLAEELDVSTETIRRDLAELEETGRINRTYGGAIRNNRFEPALNERLTINVNERRAIARAAVAEFAHADALLLGGGATMLLFARELKQIEHRLTVVTPAYTIATELAGNPLIEIMLLPGLFEAQESMVIGPETIRAIERYRAPVTVIGASGLSEAGVSEAMLGAGEVYGAMLRCGAQGVVLADHDKFDKRALVLLTGWTPQVTLITDAAPPPAVGAAIAGGGSRLVIAAPDA